MDNGGNMFASVEVKDYTIQLDGKPCVIKKERWLGIVKRKDGIDLGEENYFEGCVFDYDEKTDTYSMGGSVTKTKSEFEAESKSVCFFK